MDNDGMLFFVDRAKNIIRRAGKTLLLLRLKTVCLKISLFQRLLVLQ